MALAMVKSLLQVAVLMFLLWLTWKASGQSGPMRLDMLGVSLAVYTLIGLNLHAGRKGHQE